MYSWNRSYRGQSLGRVLHFLYWYCGFDVAQCATIGSGTVNYHGKTIATYDFPFPGSDIPFFEFQEFKAFSGEDLSKTWTQNQKNKIFDALRDQEEAKPEPCRECQCLRIQVEIWKEAACKKTG